MVLKVWMQQKVVEHLHVAVNPNCCTSVRSQVIHPPPNWYPFWSQREYLRYHWFCLSYHVSVPGALGLQPL